MGTRVTDELAQNLDSVLARIARTARDAGRDASEVRLLAVSKTHPASSLEAAYALGLRDFGENYVQELEEKARALAHLPDVRFHLIGHLQTNKAKVVAPIVACVQTLDSERLVRQLAAQTRSRRPPERGPLEVLVEVNVGGEVQKGGCAPEALRGLLAAIEEEEVLRLRGLMTVPPFTEDPNGARPFFDELRRLRELHGGQARLPELSMGMSGDLEVAVAAGSTMVRVGTALFGARPKKGAP